MTVAQLIDEAAGHIVKRRFPEAERCCRAALEVEAGNVNALNGLGVALHEQGQLDEAQRILAQVIKRAPEFGDAHFNLGRVYLERGDFDLALACFEEVLCRSPADADTFAEIGVALERQGEFEEAEEYFLEAAQFSQMYSVATMLRFSAKFLHTIDAIRKSAPLPASILRSDAGGPLALVTLVACDTKYLRKYGPAFIRSFADSADSSILLHLHVLDPDTRIAAETEILLRRAGIVRYCVTAEQDTRFASDSGEKLVWYTCARLVHLEAWLRAYDVPMLILDIDATIQSPPMRLVQTVDGFDLGLFQHRPRHAPWLDVPAGILVARPTAGALNYLRLVGNYADHFLESNSAKWHLDQCALYCTLRMLEANSRAPAVRWITDEANAFVYQVGHNYDERMTDPRYARFVPDG